MVDAELEQQASEQHMRDTAQQAAVAETGLSAGAGWSGSSNSRQRGNAVTACETIAKADVTSGSQVEVRSEWKHRLKGRNAGNGWKGLKEGRRSIKWKMVVEEWNGMEWKAPIQQGAS